MKYLVLLIIFFSNHSSSIDLTRQTPIEKTVFLKGKIGLNHFYEPSELIFYTGKLYKLIIKNVSDSKHYFGSDLFAKSIFTRKIQLTKNTNKVAEISEEEGHHPDIEFGWGYAKISITTHAIEGLSENDFILASKIDKFFNA